MPARGAAGMFLQVNQSFVLTFMLQAHGKICLRHQASQIFRPLDHSDTVAVEKLFIPDKRNLMSIFQTVKIKVINRQTAVIDVHHDKRRTLNGLGRLDLQSFRQALNEGGLPCAEIAEKTHNGSRFESFRQFFRERTGILRRMR